MNLSDCGSILTCLHTAIVPRQPDMYVYLHGFNSSGASAKGRYFAEKLAPAPVHTPSYPPEPATAIACLMRQLSQLLNTTTPILIGSSLGGFYAQYLARRLRLANVLINPALQPWLTLQPYLGWQTNYYTGERYYFGEAQLAQLRRYDVPEPCVDPVSTLLLLDAGDELIDHHVASQHYRDCARIIVYPDGNHQFVHLAQAVTAISDFRAEIVNKPLDLT